MSLSGDFWKWFDEQRNGIPVREVERRGGGPHGRISNAYHRKKEPSALVCETIAEGLGIDPIEVLTRAGFLSPKPEQIKPQSDLEIKVNELYQAFKEGKLVLSPTVEAPAVTLPEPPPVPDDEHIMELFKALDYLGRQAVYDYARWRLAEQKQRRDSSGHRQPLTDEEARQELIDYFEPLSPEERENLVMKVFDYLNSMEKIQPRRSADLSAAARSAVPGASS